MRVIHDQGEWDAIVGPLKRGPDREDLAYRCKACSRPAYVEADEFGFPLVVCEDHGLRRVDELYAVDPEESG